MFQQSVALSNNRGTLSFHILGEFKGLQTQLSVSCLHSTDSEHQAIPGTSMQSQSVSFFEPAVQHKGPDALPSGSEIQMDVEKQKGGTGEPMEVDGAPIQVYDTPAEGLVAPTTHVALDVGLRDPNAPDVIVSSQMGAGVVQENVFDIPDRPKRRCTRNV